MQTTTYAAATGRGRTMALAALAALALGGWQAQQARATSGEATAVTAGAGSATVVIRKVTDPAVGSPAFTFSSGGTGGQALPAAATFVLAGGESLSRQVDAGTSYAISEDQAVDAEHGYTLAAVGGDGCSVVGARVVVTPQAGETVTCTFVSERDRPSLSVEAAGPASASPGDELPFAYTAQNTGNVPLHDVVVSDDACAPVSGPADGADQDGGLLLPASAGPSRARPRRPRGRRTLTGTVTATAHDPHGATVTATGRHATTLTTPAGDGSGPVPGGTGGGAPAADRPGRPVPHPRGKGGHAHLHGPTGCAVRTARAVVRGHRIGRVAFRLDGRRVATVRRADRRGRWSVRVVPAGLRRGAHRLTATVTFTAGGGARTRTLRSSFSRCRAFSVRPGATG